MNAMRAYFRRLVQFASRPFQRSGPPSRGCAAPAGSERPPIPPDAESVKALRARRCLYTDLPEPQIERLRSLWPRRVAATLQAADAIRRHEFNLLGSGPFVPLDPERLVEGRAYRPIDWRLDPVSGKRFPAGMPHREWDFQKMTPPRADIKLPWELARCQHWITLAQAHRLSGESCYAVEIADQMRDFVSQNPVGLGIHWVCTMDVALRAVNWALAFELIKRGHVLGDDFWITAYRHLFEHGAFIRSNLEDRYEVTSNHFLANIVGLFYLAHVFQEHSAGREWGEFSRRMLEREIQAQVLPDGADFESSVPYHRLVAELFLGAGRIAQLSGISFSKAYTQTLFKMIDFLVGIVRPDGLMPQIGDADDGRVHIFTDYGRWQPQDARHLLAPAALLLDHASWLGHAGESGAWEAHWWGFDPPLELIRSGAPAESVRLFPDAGLAVARSGGDYLVVSNGIVGTKGFGNHKHNDQLAFEVHLDGVPLLVDPGSFVYTSDPDSRNLFRSTRYHNTVSIDDSEQNEIRTEWLFRMFEAAHAEHLLFETNSDGIEYRGRHVGYTRLSQPVVHERRLSFAPATRRLVVEDTLTGGGTHRIRWHFHFAPGVDVQSDEPGCYRLTGGGRSYGLTSRESLIGCISTGWYSPSYGVRMACQMLDISLEASLTGTHSWLFALMPFHEPPPGPQGAAAAASTPQQACP